MSVLTEGMGGGGDDPGDNRNQVFRTVVEHATATARRERELRAKLLLQKRERELRAQLLLQKRERELRAQLLQQREQLLQQREQEQRDLDRRGQEPDELIAEEQPIDDNADHLMVEEQRIDGDTSVAGGLAPSSWIEVGGMYQGLNPDDHSYQLTSDEQWFWHPADPAILIKRGTFEAFRTDGARGFYKNAHLIKKAHGPQYGNGFWLRSKPLGQGRALFDVHEYAEGGPDADMAPGYIYVPWKHIVEHLYGYTALSDKESHSFFPPGTTEAALLQYLVDALNSGRDKVQVGDVDAGIQWEEHGRRIKTFFPWLQDGHPDKYTIKEATFVKSNFS
jgi:hypothetical protein